MPDISSGWSDQVSTPTWVRTSTAVPLRAEVFTRITGTEPFRVEYALCSEAMPARMITVVKMIPMRGVDL